MKPKDMQPKLLSEVMEVIASLKDVKGSPPEKILDYFVSSKRCRMKNPEVFIKKTLKNGVKSGLIKEVSGKYKLGMDRKDYNVFKKFQKFGGIGDHLPVRQSRRRRRRRRRRSRRGRRRTMDGDVRIDDFISTAEPSDRGRRRRRRKGRRRRRGRRYASNVAIKKESRSMDRKDVPFTNLEDRPKSKINNRREEGCEQEGDNGMSIINSDHCFYGQDHDSNGRPTCHPDYETNYDN